MTSVVSVSGWLLVSLLWLALDALIVAGLWLADRRRARRLERGRPCVIVDVPPVHEPPAGVPPEVWEHHRAEFELANVPAIRARLDEAAAERREYQEQWLERLREMLRDV